MAYTKTTWANGVSPAINATNLSKIETNLSNVADGTNYYIVCGGTANALTATVTGITAYTPGVMLNIKSTAINTGNTTININGLGAKTIARINASGAINDILPGSLLYGTIIYNGTYFLLLTDHRAHDDRALIDTAGAMLYASSAYTPAKLALGTARKHLCVNAGATAPEWQDSPQSLMTATGDLLYASSAYTPSKLAIGTAGLSLTSKGGVPVWGMPAYVETIAAATVRLSANTERSTTDTSATGVTVKSFRVVRGGRLRVTGEIRRDVGGGTTQVYITQSQNGTEVNICDATGYAATTGSSTYVSFSADLNKDAWAYNEEPVSAAGGAQRAGAINIKLRATNASYLAYIRNVNICFDYSVMDDAVVVD